MNFSEQLALRIPSAERDTELYKLLQAIGTYNEVTLAEEIRALIDQNTDPSKMTAESVRKFLSFFYVPVRNVLAAEGELKVEIAQASGAVFFQPGMTVPSDNGSIFRVVSSGVGYQGDTVTLQIQQSRSNSLSGTYEHYLSFEASDIVLESLSLTVNGQQIPRVTTPRNGFMAFMFNGRVYLKVFPGTDVPTVRNQTFSIGYLSSSGKSGNVDANSFSSFAESVLDVNLKPVVLILSNAEITNGADAPTTGQLRDLLRYWLFTRNSLSKPSDYRRWYMTQPEVGDCLTWGDTEEYLRGAPLTITGKLRVCLLSDEAGVVSAAEKTVLNSRVQSVKDVTYLEYVDPTFAYHFFQIRYSGSLNDALFATDALYEVQARYNIEKLREAGMSLFDSLDVGTMSYVLARHISQPRGLEVVPYYFVEATVVEGAASFSSSFPSPNNLKRGYCKYTFDDLDAQGAVISSINYTELMTSATIAAILNPSGVQVGTHNYQTNTVTINPPGATFSDGKMRMFGEALNRSYLDTGSFSRARKLATYLGGVEFVKVAEVY